MICPCLLLYTFLKEFELLFELEYTFPVPGLACGVFLDELKPFELLLFVDLSANEHLY